MYQIKRITTKIIFIVTFLVIPVVLMAQKMTLSGYMRDSVTGESLIGATVYVKEADAGGTSNNYGFYSVTVPPGSYTVVYSYVGYATITKKMDISESQTFNAEMGSITQLKEVDISARKRDENVKNPEMGTVTLSIARIKTLPVLFGEVDILKTLTLLPGVQSAGEGNSGFYVRGGGPDQNLVLLDDAVVYNPGHLFGFFSIFNSDAVKDVTLIKGGAPANYGGRLSSVVDITMKEGNNKEFHAEGGIGIIASRLALEGPIKKNKGSFIVSARRTYIDLLARPFAPALKNSGYYFYDVNLKANYILGKKDRVYLSGYTGLDQFNFQNPTGTFKADIPWGNRTATLRWNHQYNGRLFMNTTLVYNDYNFAANFDQNDFGIKLSSGIKDYNAKTDFDYYTSFHHHLKFGLAYTYHTFTPNQVSGHVDSVVLNPDNAFVKYAHEAGVYALDEFEPTKWWEINVGLRYSYFGQVGPYTAYKYDASGNNIIDSTKYGPGQPVKSYGGLEPRFNMRFALNDHSSIKTSIAKTYQYVHLVTMNGTTLPTDVWVPSTYLVKPELAWQYSAGYFRNFLDNQLETSVEVYYKTMENQIQYKDGYVPNSLQDPELSYVFGTGTSYGSEFFINKTHGKFTGWLGYTLSWTNQDFPQLNNGQPFPAKYDRRNDISLVGSYTLNKKWNFSSVFVYGSGNAITLPTSYYFINNGTTLVEEFSKINAYRLPAYHRLDLSATYTPQHHKNHKWEDSWTFSVYNVYDRHNPYFMYVDIEGTVQKGITVTVYEVYILPILPSITYNFKF